MGQNHKRVLFDDEAGIGKALVQFVAVIVKNAAETNGNIPERDNDVATDVGILGCLQQIE